MVLQESWLKFSKCLGMSIARFVEEFFLLIFRISERRQQDKGKGVQGSTKFDLELKKLIWTVKDKENLRKKGEGTFFFFMFKVKILSWNVRGANNVEKRKMIKAFLKMQNADLVCP